MKNILLIFKNSVRRGALMLFAAVMAAVFMVVVFQALAKSGDEAQNGESAEKVVEISDKVKTGLMDHDKSLLSEDLGSYLEDTLGMDVTLENDYDRQASLLIDRDISASIKGDRIIITVTA